MPDASSISLSGNSLLQTKSDNLDVKTRVIHKMWEYIDQNFHKFSDNNKVKVCLALAQKDMPTQLDGKVSETIINIIKAGIPEDKPKESIAENGRRLSINC
jgi:hypothetical protein